MDQALLDRLLESERLPSPPAVALQVLDLIQDPHVSVTALASTIGNDPALSSKLLRVANSSFYAQARRIATVNDALVVLGLNSVRTLALGFSLVDNFRAHQRAEFDHDAFWRRSLLTAVAARTLAAHARAGRKEEAFLAGLLLNLGVLALGSGIEGYGSTFEAADGSYTALSKLEQERFGATHEEIGAAVADTWNLPDQIAACMRHHSAPDQAPPDAIDLVHMAGVGNALAELYAAAEPASALLTFRERAAWFGLDDQAADALVREVEVSVATLEAVFDLHGRANVPASTLLGRANEALMLLSLQATQDASRLAVENRELATVAATDALTGLANRRQFEEFADEQYRLAARYGSPFSLIFLDIDQFKAINDNHGHATGDHVLIAVAATLRASARGADLVARIGGDEFAVALPSTGLEEAVATAERLRAAIATMHVCSEAGLDIGAKASIGVALLDLSVHSDASAALAAADAGAYQSKRAGRNRVSALQQTIAA